MARRNWWALVACLIAIVLCNGGLAQSQTPTLYVTIGSTTLDNVANPDGANTNRVVLAPANGSAVTYGDATIGTVNITALQTGVPAMLERVTDGTVDLFALHNVKITRVSGPVTNFPITFWGTAQQLPANPPNYYYNLDADGIYGIAGAYHIDSFTLKTSIKPSGGNWTQYQSWTRSSVPTNFSTSKQSSSAFSNLGANPRDLKGELVFTLGANNDTLSFYYGSGAKARSGAQADCDMIDNFLNLFRGASDFCVKD
jgi:hypothetical protein